MNSFLAMRNIQEATLEVIANNLRIKSLQEYREWLKANPPRLIVWNTGQLDASHTLYGKLEAEREEEEREYS